MALKPTTRRLLQETAERRKISPRGKSKMTRSILAKNLRTMRKSYGKEHAKRAYITPKRSYN